MTRVKAIRLVATFDLLESLKSRKALVLLLLYLAGAFGASLIFIRVLTGLQEQLSEQLGAAVDMKMLMESPAMEKFVGKLVGDAETGRAIVAIPPMALFYGWLATNFVPLLVLFTSSDAISGDLSSGSVRFSLFRTDRLSWALGKLIGQTALMVVGVLAGALACWVTGMIWLDGMAAADTAWWLLRIAGRAAVYSFAYLGVAMCASQLMRTRLLAMGLAFALMFINSLAGGIVRIKPVVETSPELFGALSKLFPNGHDLVWWHPGLLERSAAMLGLMLIGLTWFGLGYLRFSRRDA